MRVGAQSLTHSVLFSCLLLAGASAGLAQPPSHTDTGIITDDMLTLVVGTRFVASSADDASAKVLFTDARIPLGVFNDTDHCVDQSALEVAQEYFTTLGRILGKAGHYYFVPEAEIKKAVSMCERLHKSPPQALAGMNAKVIAFGKVVPTAEAAALERSIR